MLVVLLDNFNRIMPHILIVCTANICRSPVGEAMLRERLQQQSHNSNWQVSSAGTWAQVKRGASRNSVQVAAERGLDISQHQAEMIEVHHLQKADLVLCMESGHVEALRAEFPIYAGKIFLMSEMVGREYSINDPYGGPLEAYQTMANELEGILDQGFEKITTLAEANAAKRP